jgi:hypothetical protein
MASSRRYIFAVVGVRVVVAHASVELALGVRDYPSGELLAEKIDFATAGRPHHYHAWKYLAIVPPDIGQMALSDRRA